MCVRNSIHCWLTLFSGTDAVNYQNQGQEADWPYFISAFIKQFNIPEKGQNDFSKLPQPFDFMTEREVVIMRQVNSTYTTQINDSECLDQRSSIPIVGITILKNFQKPLSLLSGEIGTEYPVV